MRRTVSAASLLALAACATPYRVAVTDAGVALVLAPRPADCRVEFYRTKPPERPYDEVSTLHFSGSADAAVAQEALRAKACELGADAVIVTRDFVVISGALNPTAFTPNQAAMTGTAVSYPELRDGHRVQQALRQAKARAEFEKGKEALKRPPNLPPEYVAARAKRDIVLMEGGVGKHDIAAGQFFWVEPVAGRFYRRGIASDGTAGFVDEDSLELAPAEPKAPPAPAAEPASKAERTNI
jgi:hypothetical protein